MDMKRPFDLRSITAQQLGCIEFVLNSPAYIEVFEPYLRQYRDSLNALWLDRSKDRKNMYPDDFLAGGVAAVDGLLKFFQLLLAETNIERIHEAMANMAPEDVYRAKQEAGEVRPVVGVDQQAMPDPGNPDEDF